MRRRVLEVCQGEQPANVIELEPFDLALFAEDGDGESAGPKPPKQIQLIPSGQKIKARDGREFQNSDPEAIVAAFTKGRMPLPVDIDHSTEGFFGGGPAAGWIETLEVKRGGSVWGAVEWNDLGRDLISSRQYRFISPAMFIDPDTREITSITSAALVNRPALRLKALSAHQGTQPEGDTMDKQLLVALGLSETATVEQAIERAKWLREQANATGVPATIEAIAAPDLAQWVPRADYTTEVARADTAEATIKAGEDATKEAAIVGAVDAACLDGKVTPAQKDQALDMCRAVGVEKFAAFIEQQQARVEPSGLDNRRVDGTASAGTGAHGLTPNELFIASKLSISPEQFAEQKRLNAEQAAARGA